MSDESSIIWTMVFSAFGFGYVMFGRRQQRVVALLAGVGMLVLPYVVTGASLLVVGVGLLLLPFLVRQ